MTRRMSCSMTTDSVRARVKTVTRRHKATWPGLRPGNRLILIEKGMGLPKGATQVILAEVEVIDVRVEPITSIFNEGEAGVLAEGVLDMSPNRFAYWWAAHHGYPNAKTVADLHRIWCRRIEWRYL